MHDFLRIRARRILLLVLPVLSLILLCSCASGDYWVDRRNDLADIFTLTVGTGLGAKARAGPFHAGLFVGEDTYGLRGGTWGDQEAHSTSDAWNPIDFDILVMSMEQYRASNSSRRNKTFFAQGGPLLCGVDSHDSAAYYTQIETAVAVVGELRVGMNPGELLDFLLGFTTLDIYGDDVRWKTRFVRAVADGNMDKVAKFLRHGTNVNELVEGRTALNLAVSNGRDEIARTLIAAGADVNAKDLFDNTPLHYACGLKPDVSRPLVNLLIEHGAIIDAADMSRDTPLMIAVRAANVDVVRQLLSVKANPDIVNLRRETPLKVAQEKGYDEIADLLRQFGATE